MQYVVRNKNTGKFYKTAVGWKNRYSLVDSIYDATVYRSISGIRNALGRRVKNENRTLYNRGPFNHMVLGEDMEIIEVILTLGPKAKRIKGGQDDGPGTRHSLLWNRYEKADEHDRSLDS